MKQKLKDRLVWFNLYGCNYSKMYILFSILTTWMILSVTGCGFRRQISFSAWVLEDPTPVIRVVRKEEFEKAPELRDPIPGASLQVWLDPEKTDEQPDLTVHSDEDGKISKQILDAYVSVFKSETMYVRVAKEGYEKLEREIWKSSMRILFEMKPIEAD